MYIITLKIGFPKYLIVKESTCQCRRHRRGRFNPWSQRSPGGGHGKPLQYSFLENPHGQRSLAGHSPWDHKESDTTEYIRTLKIRYTLYNIYVIFIMTIDIIWGCPGGASGKESACQCRSRGIPKFDRWVGKIPWRIK